MSTVNVLLQLSLSATTSLLRSLPPNCVCTELYSSFFTIRHLHRCKCELKQSTLYLLLFCYVDNTRTVFIDNLMFFSILETFTIVNRRSIDKGLRGEEQNNFSKKFTSSVD